MRYDGGNEAKMNAGEIENVIKKAVSKYVEIDGTYIFLFGSRADGTATRASDYDIGLYSGQRIPFGTIARIQDELEELRIPVFIDFVDFSAVSAEFKKIALKKVEIWNQPKTDLTLA